MKKLSMLVLSIFMVFGITACFNEADTVSHNLSQEADRFDVLRRVVFYNGITDQYLLTVEGYCSLGNDRSSVELSITCEVGPNKWKKHFLGLSDNVTYFVEQLDGVNVNPGHYKVIFKPDIIIPDIDIAPIN